MSGLSIAHPHRHRLAEGPRWDPERAQLLWVDIPMGRVFAGTLDHADHVEVVEQVDVGGTVGAVAPAADGGWLIAGANSLLVRAPGQAPRPWIQLIAADGRRRLNDGATDPAGRYLVGTLSMAGTSATEQLFAVDHAGGVSQIDGDLTLSNGLGWSADGTRLFSVDSDTSSVYVRRYDSSSGRCGERECFVQVEGPGVPDGMCVDADDHLWIAIWGAGEVRRYSPAGDLSQVVAVPAPHVSSVAFAGPELETLVITTATEGLTPAQMDAHPDSGCIFTTQPGARGLAQAPWAGTTL